MNCWASIFTHIVNKLLYSHGPRCYNKFYKNCSYGHCFITPAKLMLSFDIISRCILLVFLNFFIVYTRCKKNTIVSNKIHFRHSNHNIYLHLTFTILHIFCCVVKLFLFTYIFFVHLFKKLSLMHKKTLSQK